MSTSSPEALDLLIQTMNVKVNIDPTQGITTGDQHRYYTELGVPWTEGLNIVNGGNIIQRKFSELAFPTNTPIWVEEEDLGYYDQAAGGQRFYKVTTNFQENTYTSSSGFYKWHHAKNLYLLEKWFYNTIDQEVKWVPEERIKVFPHTVRFNPGKALGVDIESSHPILINGGTERVRTKKISPLGDVEITLTIPNAKSIPTNLVVKLYGLREAVTMRRFHLLNELVDEREVLIHPLGTRYEERLVPPTKAFNPRFWNDPFKDRTQEVLVDRPLLSPHLTHGFIEEPGQ